MRTGVRFFRVPNIIFFGVKSGFVCYTDKCKDGIALDIKDM